MSDDLARASTDAPLGRVMSHGRGGAGNIGYDPNGLQEGPEDLKIPELKSPVYTTGRGGTGNMAINDPTHPEATRAAQDVDTLPVRTTLPEYHGGRGGAGNVIHAGQEEEAERREAEERRRLEEEQARKKKEEALLRKSNGDYRGLADKGKDFLFAKFGRKKSPAASESSS